MHEKFHILLVEDNEADAFLLQRSLRRAGIKCDFTVVTHGQESIDYLAGHKQYSDRKKFPFPDLLILDLRMPMKDGFQVLEWIQEQPALADLRVVTMSGSNMQETVDRVKKLGAVAYIMKRTDFNSIGSLFHSMASYHEQIRKWQQQGQALSEKPAPPGFVDDRIF